MRHTVIAAIALLLAVVAVPAGAQTTIEPTLRTEQVFFHCDSPNKLANVDAVVNGQSPSWDTTAPSTSFTAGGGCGFYDNLLSGTGPTGQPTASAIWSGTFTGNLDTVAVELHRLLGGAGGSVTAPQLVAILTIDGTVVFDGDITPFFTVSDTGASESTTFSFPGLKYVTEDGDGEKERTVTLQIDSYNEAQTAWVFDASEVPAGLTFNPEDRVKPEFK